MKIKNKKASEAIDQLILEENLRIKQLVLDSDLDLMVVILNNGNVLKVKISEFPRLKNASSADLNDWTLIADGVGVHWEKLDEDLSLKGFIQNAALNNAIRDIVGNGGDTRLSA